MKEIEEMLRTGITISIISFIFAEQKNHPS